MRRILTVVGTRPEAIKLAPVILELDRRQGEVSQRVCVTAQHREMLDQVLGIFGISPDLDLDLMEEDQLLPDLTARLMTGLAAAYESESPDVVVVQGDTTTVMVAALAAFYAGIDVAHVEAGLRSHDMSSPFPEELNRRVASLIARYHFAPTVVAEAQLISEGIDPSTIWMTGNTIVDALLQTAERLVPDAARRILDKAMGGAVRRLILVTAHRRENFGDRIEGICDGIRRIVDAHPDVCVVYPVHMNRNVREPVHRLLDGVDRVTLTEPVEYDTLVHLIKASYLVMTDSGGIQEEAPALGKPVLVLRTETERPEGIDAGTALLIGPWADQIADAAGRLLEDDVAYDEMAKAVSPYGDGHAAERIAEVLSA